MSDEQTRARALRRTRHLLNAAAAATQNPRTRVELDAALLLIDSLEFGHVRGAPASDDTARLDAMESGGNWVHNWVVSPQVGGGWVVSRAYGSVGGDYDEIEMARTRGSLRDALDLARAAA
jgi:hypothetical protein